MSRPKCSTFEQKASKVEWLLKVFACFVILCTYQSPTNPPPIPYQSRKNTELLDLIEIDTELLAWSNFFKKFLKKSWKFLENFEIFGFFLENFLKKCDHANTSIPIRRVILEKTQPVKWPTTGSNSWNSQKPSEFQCFLVILAIFSLFNRFNQFNELRPCTYVRTQ